MTRPKLRALARQCGVLDAYRANDGARRTVTDATREALVTAMGFEASSERAAAVALREQQESVGAGCLDAVAVVRADRPDRLRARVPEAWQRRCVAWSLELVAEGGPARHVEGRARVGQRGALAIPSPALASGIYEARLQLECGSETRTAAQWVFVAPPACVDVERRLGRARAFGVWTHLYALARSDDLGIGDLRHLDILVEKVAQAGGAFVAVQPFHALGNTSRETSPYSPTSRLFRNPIYLDLEAVPEFRDCDAAHRALADFQSRGTLDALRNATQLDYEAVTHVKRFVLERLFHAFRSTHANKTTERGRAYQAYVAREGEALQTYAAFCALADRFGGTYRPATDWRRWPTRFHNPRDDAVRERGQELCVESEFHQWLQFETDRQLADLGARAKARLPLGLMGDLALGSGRGSADTWAHRELFVEGASLGAPPDAFADGQDWDLPPLHPLRSRADGHTYWRRVLRCSFAGMGALRIDHVMGLFRQFWIPAGRPPGEGAYVEIQSREVLALLAIESQRANAVVVGEDLGTRPGALAPRLARASVLSTRVLPFERTRGAFHKAARFGNRAYVTAHTHDLPPLGGWVVGRDIELRHAAGELQAPGALKAAREARCRDVTALCRRLAHEGWVDENTEALEEMELGPAVTAFLGSTPAPLLAISVDDLVGERDPLNLPAISSQRSPNWAHRMTIAVDAIADHPTGRAMIAAIPLDRRLDPPSEALGQAADPTERDSLRPTDAKSTRGRRTRDTTSRQA